MSNIKREPKKFVNLHGHSNFSLGDGLNFPQEHIDFAIENGLDGLALTDHGNMNGFAHQYFHWNALKKKGVNFKAIPGNEAYFIDSLDDWDLLHKKSKQSKLSNKKLIVSSKAEMPIIGDEFAKDKQELEEAYKINSEEDAGSVLENEVETKQYQKYRDPLKQRNHMVVLPKNQEGLYSLFKLTSLSYINGYYFFPRMDFKTLEQHAKGNLIITQACLGGRVSKIIFDNQIQPFEKWGKDTIHDNEELIQQEIKKISDQFAYVLGGKENFYLELQFNKLPQQHLTNYHFIQAHKKFGIPIVATCDSHYCRPEYWRERELHKLMAWSTKTKGEMDIDSIAKTADELKAELYPKNAKQLWNTHLSLKDECGFYSESDDEVIFKAIEQSYIIAHEQIDKNIMEPNKKIKLPSLKNLISDENKLEKYFSDDRFKDEHGETDEDKVAFEELKRHAIDGLVWRKKHTNQKYIDQLKFELDTMKHLKVAKYILTYEKLMKQLQKEMITGPGRGSGAGSLVCYVLSITQLDPLQHGLLFSRFMSKVKHGMPDIDCLDSNHLIVMSDGTHKKISEVKENDAILSMNGSIEKVNLVQTRNQTKKDKTFTLFIYENEEYGAITCNHKHKFFLDDKTIKFCNELKVGEKLYKTSTNKNSPVIIAIAEELNSEQTLTDISVSGDCSFQVIPWDCIQVEDNSYDINYLISINEYHIDTDEMEYKINEIYKNGYAKNWTTVQL